MKKQVVTIAVYVDMENIASTDFELEDLMNTHLKGDDDHSYSFAIKAAYGNQATSKKILKDQLICGQTSFIRPSQNPHN